MLYVRPNFIGVYVVDPRSLPEPHYLLLKRCGKYLPGIWQMVTGKVDPGETVSAAAFRELHEEAGQYAREMFSVDVTSFYNQEKDAISFSANFCVYVPMASNVILSENEHSEFAWLTFKEAASLLAFPEQVITLKKIHEYFVLREPSQENRVFRLG